MKRSFAMRLIAALLVVVVTGVLGSGVVWTAGDSLPGNPLYPIKLATEDVRLALASTPADQIDLALQFVEERAEEMQSLVVAGQLVPDEAIARMERHIESALIQAAWASDGEIAGLLTRIAERTRTQAQMLGEVQATAPQQASAGLGRAVAVCRQGAEAAEDGMNDPYAFRRRYRDQQGTPEPANEREQATVTPEGDQEQDQEGNQQRDQERTPTPVDTPHVTPQLPQATPLPRTTPQGSQATPVPQATPKGSQATSVPQATPKGSQATSVPQATPKGPQATSVPQATPQGYQRTPVPSTTMPQPQDPGHGQGGSGQGGSGQGGGN